MRIGLTEIFCATSVNNMSIPRSVLRQNRLDQVQAEADAFYGPDSDERDQRYAEICTCGHRRDVHALGLCDCGCANFTKETQFYMQDMRQIVGNCMLWWAKDGAGYTCNLKLAHVYSEVEILKQSLWRVNDIAWPKGYIDALVTPMVDQQKVGKRIDVGQKNEKS